MATRQVIPGMEIHAGIFKYDGMCTCNFVLDKAQGVSYYIINV